MAENATRSDDAPVGRFGTFGAVFTPSLLTILGVIMFLRLSTVVGNAGLWHALLVIGMANLITLITGLSISAIATNMRVRGGGAYYLISRSIGIEFGGVIAIFFYLAQTVAVTMYVVGFTEALYPLVSGIGLSFRTIATITNILVFACVITGAGWAIRIQYVILTVLLLAIVSFFVGAALDFSPEVLRANLETGWTRGHSFFTIFALFFPAVTGIMAGVNMSGDLKDPSRSLPLGVLSVIGVSAFIYIGIAIMLAASISRAALVGEGFVMMENALFPSMVYAGVICATLSSALGSMMGAPRIIQAFARDDIFRMLRWFGRGSGWAGEPRNAIIVTFVIAQIGIFAGDLDTVAPVITMFFLLTYGTVNLACFNEMRSRNPSFRPGFRLKHWSIPLAGALGCIAVMFLVSALWAAVALVVSGLLYYLINRADVAVEWGDVQSGLAYQRARNSLLRLEHEVYHPKNWRPSIIALSGGAYNRLHLAEYACWFTADSGIVSIGQVILGDLDTLYEEHQRAEVELRTFILDENIAAFPVVVVEEDLHTAVTALVQCHGISGLRPNTVLLGWSQDPARAEMYTGMLRLVKRMRRSLIIVACEQKQQKTRVPDGAINLWWENNENDALMVLLAYMLKKAPEWHQHPMRIIRPVGLGTDVNRVEEEMDKVLAVARIESELAIVPTENPREAVREAMGQSAVLFAGFDPEASDFADLQQTVDLPGDVILVYSAGDASLEA